MVVACGGKAEKACKIITSSELAEFSAAVSSTTYADHALSALIAFKDRYREALVAANISGYSEAVTQEIWLGTKWGPAPRGAFPASITGKYARALTFSSGEYLLGSRNGQYLRLVGKEFVLTIEELFSDPVYAYTSRTLSPGWGYDYQLDTNGEAKFPGGVWRLEQKGMQELFLSAVTYHLPGYDVELRRTAQGEISLLYNQDEACPSAASAIVRVFPDVPSLLTITYPPFAHTMPIEWLDAEE
jgi:hypothetical protein